MQHKLFFLSALLGLQFSLSAQPSFKTYLFVGSYTSGVPGTGIYVYEFNNTSGKLKPVSHVDNITNSSFLCVSQNGQFLYACTDTKLTVEGSITAFKIDSLAGKIAMINKQPSGGGNPVYLTAHKNNRFVVNGNYDGGNVSVFRTNNDGSLNPYSQLIQFSDSSINKERQQKSHIHSTVFSPDNRYVFLPDLGADKIRVFKFNAESEQPLMAKDSLVINTVAGSGPRHFTFHPNAKFAYCIEELSGMVSAYAYNNGKLDSIQRTFSYSKKQNSYGSADIHISPDGLFLYASNRWDNENTISIFSIDQQNGRLTLKGHQSTLGDHPRNFTMDDTGRFLLVANQVSGTIVVFKRNLKTGMLNNTGTKIKVSMPSCLQMRTYHVHDAVKK